jgi:hypothetical protein
MKELGFVFAFRRTGVGEEGVVEGEEFTGE